ncbi:hypothetical protein AKO1_009553 [Acrasis kona]|uniref:Uncharacterized protein n=1 Tax=Acrasis kona TaxID=1008807 RepID=A0AAW2ZMB1_9EUKA
MEPRLRIQDDNYSRNLHMNHNNMKMYNNVDFWKKRHSMRQINQYANLLLDKLHLDHEAPQNNVIDYQTQGYKHFTQHQDDDPFYFDENNIPTPSQSYAVQSNTLKWSDPQHLYTFIHRPHMVSSSHGVKKDFTLWNKIRKTHSRLSQLIQTERSIKSIKQAYDQYIFALCRVSLDPRITSYILCKYLLRSHSSFDSDPNDSLESDYIERRDELIDLLERQRGDRKIMYAKAGLTAVVIGTLTRTLRGLLSKILKDPTKELKVDCNMFGLKCKEFINKCWQVYGSDKAAIKFNIGLLCCMIKRRLFLNEEWQIDFEKMCVGSELIIDLVRNEFDVFALLDPPVQQLDPSTLRSYVREADKLIKKKKDSEKKEMLPPSDEPSISLVLLRDKNLLKSIKDHFNIEQVEFQHIKEFARNNVRQDGDRLLSAIEGEKQEESVVFNPIVETIKIQKQQYQLIKNLRQERNLEDKLRMMRTGALKLRNTRNYLGVML